MSGTLRTGDVAGASRGLTLQAPAGTVYVAGTIDADGTAAGPAGGAITISAQRIVITGSVSASGADGTVGGDGAAVTLAARDLMFLGGAVRLHGGAGTTAGGRGGLLTIDTAAPSRRWISSTRAGARPATGSRACPARSASASRRSRRS